MIWSHIVTQRDAFIVSLHILTLAASRFWPGFDFDCRCCSCCKKEIVGASEADLWLQGRVSSAEIETESVSTSKIVSGDAVGWAIVNTWIWGHRTGQARVVVRQSRLFVEDFCSVLDPCLVAVHFAAEVGHELPVLEVVIVKRLYVGGRC